MMKQSRLAVIKDAGCILKEIMEGHLEWRVGMKKLVVNGKSSFRHCLFMGEAGREGGGD